MKFKFLKNLILLTFFITSGFFVFGGADRVEACTVLEAKTRPIGEIVNYSDNAKPIIYLDIQTQDCNTNPSTGLVFAFNQGQQTYSHPYFYIYVNFGVAGGSFSGAPGITTTESSLTIPIKLGEQSNVGTSNVMECGTGEVCKHHLALKVFNPSVGADYLYEFQPPPNIVRKCDGFCNVPWDVGGTWCVSEQSVNQLPYEGSCLTLGDSYQVTTFGSGSGTGSLSGMISEEPLAPIPGFSAGQDLGKWLEAVFTILIVIAGILSLIMIVVGAVTYMTSDAFSKKSDGKVYIVNAITGLVLALGAWIILNTINPNLASNLGISIPKVSLDGPTKEWAGGNASQGTNICPGKTVQGQNVLMGNTWPSDQAQRNQLASVGINVVSSQNSSCPTAGAPGCTSVYFEGPASNIPDKIIELKNQCPSCDVVVTGGSECWLHRSHGPSNRVVDLRDTETLNSFINALAGNNMGSNFPSNQTITLPGIGKFYAEPAGANSNTTAGHWHVTLD